MSKQVKFELDGSWVGKAIVNGKTIEVYNMGPDKKKGRELGFAIDGKIITKVFTKSFLFKKITGSKELTDRERQLNEFGNYMIEKYSRLI